MRCIQHADHSRRGNGATADHSVIKRHGLAIGSDEQIFCCTCWRGFTAVKSGDAALVIVKQECTATDATGLRLNQAQHHLYGNRRIQGIATLLQNFQAGFCGYRIGGGHG